MPKVKSKIQYWVINVASWGVRLMKCSEAKAEEFRAHKANWEGSVASKIEIPKWLYEHLKWHRDNSMAFDVASYRMFGKEKHEELMVSKEKLRAEYAKKED